MRQSTIHIEVTLDDNKVPNDISWTASDSTAAEPRRADAMMLAMWDRTEKTALRIDLWTPDMMVDEMADFYYQTLITMADSLLRATQQGELVSQMKQFAKDFRTKFREKELKENKA
jgi:gliding motility-associated protein GldC